MFVTLRTLFYFPFNVINALCLLYCLSDANNLMYVMFGELDCLLRVFDPDHLLVVSVRNELIVKLRVFDLSRLLVVRWGT